MEEIKNCPLCGSRANIESYAKNDYHNYVVACSNKKCRLKSVTVRTGRNELFEGKCDVDVTPVMAMNHVVTAWNKRTDEPDQEQEIIETAKVVKVRRVHCHE